MSKPANGPNTSALTYSPTFTIPASVAAGLLRMRISMKRGAAPTPCETFQFGEVEDYSIDLTNGTVILPPPPPPPPVGCTGNLLKNAGFENGLTDWGYGSTNVAIVTDAFSGTKALQICGANGFQLQNLVVEVGKTYQLSGQVKVSAANIIGAIAYTFIGANGQSLASLSLCFE